MMDWEATIRENTATNSHKDINRQGEKSRIKLIGTLR